MVTILGHSRPILDAKRLARQVAKTDFSVLILGESGTGKELFARYIHENSKRASKPFVAINCSAIPETMMEAEIFGIEKGVATGVDRRSGWIAAANGGTLFLDELCDMPLPLQAKILRVLQEREYVPVGGRVAVKVDIRIIAATNQEVMAEIGNKNLRADLYYRIADFPLHLPPLRDRGEDINFLAEHFIEEFSHGEKRLSQSACQALTGHQWPGNVRELQSVLKRAIVYSGKRKLIRTEDVNHVDKCDFLPGNPNC